MDTGEKVEYKLQGTILRVKKANGDVSSVVAGKSVVLKSVTEDGNERGVVFCGGGPWGGQFRSFFWWLKRGKGRQKVGVELMYLMKKG